MEARSLQTEAPLERLNLNITAREAIGLTREMQDGDMTVDLPYQRGSVWNDGQRIELVRSWQTGTPIPAVIMNDRTTVTWRNGNWDGDLPEGEAAFAVIDGKQRLLTAVAWFTGRLLVPASWWPADEVEETEQTSDGPYLRYTGLTRPGRLHCARGSLLAVGVAKVATVEEEAALYLRVNGSGTAQTAEDMTRAARVAAR